MNLYNPKTVLSLLKNQKVSPKKSFGQNFLLEKKYLDTALEAAEINTSDTVLEIGIGVGVLTYELCKLAKKVIAVELDQDMVDIVGQVTCKDFDNLEIIHEDILKYTPKVTDYKVVANIPYNITGHLLRHLLENIPNKPKVLVLLVQKEVANKICASCKNMNMVALGVQMFGSPTYVCEVPKDSFYPAPKVDSALVKIECFNRPVVEDYQAVFRLAGHCFRGKRKMLKKTLSSLFDDTVLESIAKEIDVTRRPQGLSIEEWSVISQWC